MTTTIKGVHEISKKINGDDMVSILETLVFLQDSFTWETDLTDERTRTEWVNAIFEAIENLQENDESYQEMEYMDILQSEKGYMLSLKLAVKLEVISASKAMDYFVDKV